MNAYLCCKSRVNKILLPSSHDCHMCSSIQFQSRQQIHETDFEKAWRLITARFCVFIYSYLEQNRCCWSFYQNQRWSVYVATCNWFYFSNILKGTEKNRIWHATKSKKIGFNSFKPRWSPRRRLNEILICCSHTHTHRNHLHCPPYRKGWFRPFSLHPSVILSGGKVYKFMLSLRLRLRYLQ